MSEVIVVTSGKGGVGKTTTTANIGYALARHGFEVLLIDTDIGLRNLDVVMGLENRIVYNLVDVVEGNCRHQQAIIRDKQCDTLSLLPAAQTRDKSAVSPEQMIKLINQLKPDYDYKNAIAAAKRAIVVTTPEVSAIRDADRIIGILNANEIPRIDLVVNRVRQDMVKRGEMMSVEDVVEILGVNHIGSVYDDENIVIASNRGTPIATKNCVAGRAYDHIAMRICGQDLAKEEKRSRLFGWLKKKDKDVHKIQSQRL